MSSLRKFIDGAAKNRRLSILLVIVAMVAILGITIYFNNTVYGKVYTVDYVGFDKSTVVYSEKVKYGAEIALPDPSVAPAPEGFEFACWECDDHIVTEDTTVYAEYCPEDPAYSEDITFTALWEQTVSPQWTDALRVMNWHVPGNAHELDWVAVANSGQTNVDYVYIQVSEDGSTVNLYFLATANQIFRTEHLPGNAAMSFAGINGTLIGVYGNEGNISPRYIVWQVSIPAAKSLQGNTLRLMSTALGHSIIDTDLTITNLGYETRHYTFDTDPRQAALYITTPGVGTAGMTVTAGEIEIEGYTLTYVEDLTRDSGTIENGETLILKLFYQKDPEPMPPTTITITANSAERAFNGAPLTDSGFTTSELPDGVTRVEAAVEGSQTDIGSSYNAVTGYRLWDGDNEVTDDYAEAVLEKGILTVTPGTGTPGTGTPGTGTPGTGESGAGTPDSGTEYSAGAEAPDATVNIYGEGTPLPGKVVPITPEVLPHTYAVSWSLINLILTIATALITVFMYLVAFPGRNRIDEYVEGRDSDVRMARKDFFFRLLGIAATVIAVILFAYTQDMRLRMVFTDKWTVWHEVITAATVLLGFLSYREYKKEESDLTGTL